MKAFLVACIATVVIAVGADMMLDRIGFSSEEVYRMENVRLGE